MKRNGIKIDLLVAILLFLMANAYTISAQESGYEIEVIELVTYRNGLVHVDSLLVVNETVPSISFELITSSLDNVLVVDENLTVLDYEIDTKNMTIFSFGASRVRVEYDTIALTEKESGVWTLLLKNPYDVTAYLPLESIIVYLNNMPSSLNTEKGIITLSLYPSEWEISYVLPISGPALFKVSDLTAIPSEVEAGDEVVISVIVANVGDAEGSYTILLQVNGEEEDTKTVMLDAGASAEVEFKFKKSEGTYNVEVDGLTAQFKVKESLLISNYYFYVIILVIFGAAVSLIILYKKRASNKSKMLSEYSHFRKEERDVITFLEERGGQAFESEIRGKFPEIPKTSLWRLIKRLEKFEIVSIKRIGLQNQVILKK